MVVSSAASRRVCLLASVLQDASNGSVRLEPIFRPTDFSSLMDSGNVTFHQGAWFFLLVFCSAEPSNAESLLYRAYILAPAASASP